MDRLTTRIDGEVVLKAIGKDPCEWVINSGIAFGDFDCRDFPITNAFEKLAHYEDLAEQGRLVDEEDVLKFYYIDSEDKYVVGQRIDTMYYAEVTENLDLCFYMSRYLPWGEHSHCSEPREIPFSEWLKGFIRKREEAEAKLVEKGGTHEI